MAFFVFATATSVPAAAAVAMHLRGGARIGRIIVIGRVIPGTLTGVETTLMR